MASLVPSFLRRRLTDRPVTASATRLQLDQPSRARKQAGQRMPWQQQCWRYFDLIPEVKTSTWFKGNAVGRVKLLPAVEPPERGAAPIAVDDPASGISPQVAALAWAEIARLKGPLGGQAEIMREIEMNVTVAGECFLVGWGAIEPGITPQGTLQEGRDESWDVRSIDEVEIKGSGDSTEYLIKDSPTDRGQRLNPETDTIIRIWRRHPRWSALADCELNGVRGECEALVTLHAELLADSRSRHNAGMFTLPNELSFGAPPDDGEDSGDDVEADPLMDELTEVFSEPVDDPTAPGAVAPAGLRGPGEWLKPDYVRWVDMGRKPSAELDNRIKARVERLARGIGLPVEKVMGHQSTTFANAAQVDEDEFTDYIEPDVQLIVDALTGAYLRANLADAGVPLEVVERIIVWYDPSDAIRDPDMSEAADKGYELNEISGAGWRQLRGVPEDMAPDPIEVLIRAGLRRGILTADLTLALLNLLGQTIDVEPIPKAPTEQLPSGTDDQATSEAAAQMALERLGQQPLTGYAAVLARHPGFATRLAVRRLARDAIETTAVTAAGRPARRVVTGLGRRLMDVDMNLRSQVLVLADRTLNRAIERAGARLRSQVSLRNVVKDVPTRLVAAHLGPSLVADAGQTPADLLAGALEPMREQFMAWGATAQSTAIDLVSRTVGGFTAERRAELGLRQARSLEEAWAWLESALTHRAETLLFDPTAVAGEALGEVAANVSVPPGMVREALAIAGGATPVGTTSGSDAWVTLSREQYRGGIGTGDLVSEVLAGEGYGVQGYEWVYGPAARSRPFEPHADLDGVTFEDFSDPQLAVTGSFPDGAYYLPGDHVGCLCDVAPVIIEPDGSTTLDV